MIFQTKYNNEYTFLHKSIHIILGGILGIKLVPFEYKKIEIDESYPKYIFDNKSMLKEWII